MGRMPFSLVSRARYRRMLTSLAVLFMVAPAVVPGVAVARTAGHGAIAVTAAPHAAPVRTATDHSKDVRFASLGWKVQTVSGPNPVLDVFVPGPGNFTFGPQTRLSLTYSSSPEIDPQASWLTVSMNDAYVADYHLSAQTAGPTTLLIAIPPAALIGNGYNHLQLAFGLRDRTTHSACSLDPNSSVSVYGTSMLHYDLRGPATTRFRLDLAALPAPFVPAPNASVSTQITVGLPNAPTTTELTGIGRILARFGEDAPANPPAVSALLAGALALHGTRNDLLLIGTPRDNPAIARIDVPAPLQLVGGLWWDAQGRREGHVLPSSEGLIVEARNPWDRDQTVLVVTGNGQEGIRRAAMLLGSATLRRLLRGSFVLLPTAPRLPAIPHFVQGTMTLQELGYQAVTLQLGDPTVPRFDFDLTQLPQKDGLFTLIYSHSSTATPALSSVRVDLNGNPLVSRPFAVTDPPRIRWRIPLPVDQLHVGTNVVTVRFFLGAPGTDCIAPPAASVWASIDPSSSLTLPATHGSGYPDLSLVPFPMVVDGDLNQTLLIVPGRAAAGVPSGEALNTAVLLGAASQVDAPQLTVLAAEQVTPAQLRGRTVILDGLAQSSPLMARIQAQLPLRLATGGSLQLTGQTTELQATAGELSAVGVIEELPSPWDATQTAVLVSASQPRLLPLTQHALFRANLSGTVATVDAAGRLQTFDTRTPAEAAAEGESRSRPIRLMTFAGLGLLLALVMFTALRRLRIEGKLQ